MSRRVALALATLNTLAMTAEADAQTFQFDTEAQKKTFASTYWEPNRGVKLLDDEAALAQWHLFTRTCNTTRNMEGECSFVEVREWEHVTSLYVFTTEHLILFVFTMSTNSAQPDWLVYRRRDKALLYHAHGLDGGYNHEVEQSPPQGGDACGDSVSTTTRFRPYLRTGPLLMETHVHICQRDENHHEFLFHLDEETLTEVPGSRFIQDRGIPMGDEPWLWWHAGPRYVRFGDLSWNDEGERVWRRRVLALAPGQKSKAQDELIGALHERSCRYDSKAREVVCTTVCLKEAEVPLLPEEVQHHEPTWRADEPRFKKIGLHYSSELKAHLEQIAKTAP